MGTNIKDMNGREICVGNILVNPMIGDLWNVDVSNNRFIACLIPSSGIIEHPNSTYPVCTEDIEDISESFYVLDLEHLGYKGSVGYDYIDNYYHGKLTNTDDLVTYNGDNVEELLKEFRISVEEYINFKEELR